MSSLQADNLQKPITGTESGGKRAVDINIAASDVALGGGTQYTEGVTDATITGTAMMMEGDGNALIPAQGTAEDGMLVNLGSNNDITGTVTANAGTNLNTSALALESGGNLASAATLLGTIDADTGNISTKIDTLAGAVAGSEMQVDVLTVPADPFGANADAAATAGSTGSIQAKLRLMTSQLDSIKTSVETLDNIVSGNEAQVDLVGSIPSGSNLIGDVGISGARTSGGATPYKNIDVDESEDQIKGTAGQIYLIHCINLASSKRYLKFYNATAANVTVGTTVPDYTFPIPTTGDTNGAGFVLAIPNGIAFSTAITVAATTGLADNDAGAPGANEVILNLAYA